MNPFQVMGIIAGCASVFAGVVTLLAMQGVHVLIALLGVYVVAVSFMLLMQRRATESSEVMDDRRLRRFDRDSLRYRARARDFSKLNSPTSVVSEQLH